MVSNMSGKERKERDVKKGGERNMKERIRASNMKVRKKKGGEGKGGR
jgi:hypothetical protein